MTTLTPLVDDARERLLARARREGLIAVSYDVMDSPLGPLWVAVGPRGVIAIHYGARPDERELARITRTYGPGVVPDRRRCDDRLQTRLLSGQVRDVARLTQRLLRLNAHLDVDHPYDGEAPRLLAVVLQAIGPV